MLHAIGFNLDIPGSHEKAVTAFSKLLELTPNDPKANYQHGAFLAATTRKGEGIPFLEKAKAIENLENYMKRVPSDQKAARVLDAVRNDQVKFEERKINP